MHPADGAGRISTPKTSIDRGTEREAARNPGRRDRRNRRVKSVDDAAGVSQISRKSGRIPGSRQICAGSESGRTEEAQPVEAKGKTVGSGRETTNSK